MLHAYLVNNMMALALQKALFGVLCWSESQKLSGSTDMYMWFDTWCIPFPEESLQIANFIAIVG